MPELVHMDEDTLTHYGRLGMKWGQHIFTSDYDDVVRSGTARQARRALNKMESSRAKYVARTYNPAVKRYLKEKKKLAKVSKKYNNDLENTKVKKQVNKTFDAIAKKVDAETELNRGQAAIGSLAKKLSDTGRFDMKATHVQHWVSTGNTWVTGLATTAAASALVATGVTPFAFGYIPYTSVSGYHYSVKNKKGG